MAIISDKFGSVTGGGAQVVPPGQKADLECLRIDRHTPQSVLWLGMLRAKGRDSAGGQVLPSPQFDLDEVIRPANRRAQQQKQDFRQDTTFWAPTADPAAGQSGTGTACCMART
jgi:hypothetical protein